jgi:hypothetical protein
MSDTTDRDRELLERAAKAAGYRLDGPAESFCTSRRKNDMLLLNERGGHSVWNPRDDDGDALRLANRVGICIEFGFCLDDAPIVRCGRIEDRDNWPQVANFPDSGKATRRAIVEAAAAIQMEYEAAAAALSHTATDGEEGKTNG